MRRPILILTAVLLAACSTTAFALRKISGDSLATQLAALMEWRAGATVSDEAIRVFGGPDSCFVSKPIPDRVWRGMQGKTYQENPHISRNDLRHVRVLHWDYDNRIHVGEMVCNQLIADRLVRIFRKLYAARYPIQRMVLPDVYDADDERQMRDNNTSCFCYRPISGTSRLSKHARGLAVDINSLYNPYIKVRKDGSRFIQPANAAAYCNRKRNFRYKITSGDLCYRLFKAEGFVWGGDWQSLKDYQHFELME
jgi:hypothetical protein